MTESEKQKLIERNIGIVGMHAKRFLGRGMDFDDMVQEGIFGLYDAARKFDPSRGVKFTTYASFWIKQKIMKSLQSNRLVHVPSTAEKCRRKGKYCRYQRELDVAMGVPERLFSADGNPRHLVAKTETALIEDSELAAVNAAMKRLKPREEVVIRRRYFEGKTLEDVGNDLDLSKERIRQIEIAALHKIRMAMMVAA